MKKIGFFLLTIAVLSWAVYFSGIDLSFLGLRSAILSEENCDSSLLLANKAEYTKSVADLVVINNYITLNACEGNGFGKTNFEIAACERKIALKKNKTLKVSYTLNKTTLMTLLREKKICPVCLEYKA